MTADATPRDDSIEPINAPTRSEMPTDEPVVVTCDYILRHLPAIADGECTGRAIADHLRDATCECPQMIALERGWKRIVRQAAKSALAPDDETKQRLIESVEMASLQQQMTATPRSRVPGEIGGIRPVVFVPLGIVAAVAVALILWFEPMAVGVAADAVTVSPSVPEQLAWQIPREATHADVAWLQQKLDARHREEGGAQVMLPNLRDHDWRLVGATDRLQLDWRPAISLLYERPRDPSQRFVAHFLPWHSPPTGSRNAVAKAPIPPPFRPWHLGAEKYFAAEFGNRPCVAWVTPTGALCVVVLLSDAEPISVESTLRIAVLIRHATSGQP